MHLKVVHLDKEDEIQKIPLQPPYYDMAKSETTAFTDKPVSSAAKLIAVCVSLALVVSVKVGLRSPASREHLMYVVEDELPSERSLHLRSNPAGLISA